MRDNNLDLRVIRTKESIRKALVQLIEEKGFDAITVKDITTVAKINRGTFYAHYQDKFDLVTKCEDEIMQGMFQLIMKNFPKSEQLNEMNPLISPAKIAVVIFSYLYENRDFMRAMLSPKGDITFQTKIKQFMWNEIFVKNSNVLIKEENLLVPSAYFASYVASAHIGVIQQWLNNGCQETPEEMATILSTLTLNGPLYAAGLKK